MTFSGAGPPWDGRGANEDQELVADLTKAMLVRQTSLPAGDRTRLSGAAEEVV
jgi:hypothetical protein